MDYKDAPFEKEMLHHENSITNVYIRSMSKKLCL